MAKTVVAIAVLFFASLSAAQQQKHLDILSGTSLRLEILHDDISLGSATGFVLKKNERYWLVTNRHVALLCAPDKDPSDVGGWVCANKLGILHNKEGHVGEWLWTREELYQGDGRTRRWREHPQLQGSVDLIALPLTITAGVAFNPLDLELRKTQIVLKPGDQVTIVGFPLGLSQGGGLAIWKSGTLASDADVDFDGKAKFLLDTTARPGMSGSPVYARRSGAYPQEGNVMAVGSATKFLGVYSEENQAAELGAVWKAEIIVELYDSLPQRLQADGPGSWQAQERKLLQGHWSGQSTRAVFDGIAVDVPQFLDLLLTGSDIEVVETLVPDGSRFQSFRVSRFQGNPLHTGNERVMRPSDSTRTPFSASGSSDE